MRPPVLMSVLSVFAIWTSELRNYDLCKRCIWIFYLYRILKFSVIYPHIKRLALWLFPFCTLILVSLIFPGPGGLGPTPSVVGIYTVYSERTEVFFVLQFSLFVCG